MSVALIAWATRRIDWAEAAGRLRSASPGWLLLAIAVVALTVALTGERWRVLLARLGWPLAHALTLRFAAIGHFFNQGLPSTIGGDAMRVWLAHREGVPVGEAVRSVLLERLSGLATLLLLALAGLPALLERVGPGRRGIAAAILVLGGLAGLALAWLLVHENRVLARWRWGAQLVRLAGDARVALAHGPTLAALLALSLASQLLLCFAVAVLARAFGAPLAALDAVLIMPIVLVLLIVPISIAGWGLRESLMIVGLGIVGVGATDALLVSMGYGLANLVVGLGGGAWWLMAGERAPPEAA